MTHVRTPALGVPWWRRLLTLEPVAVQGVARAALVLASTLGLTISDDVSGQLLAAIAAAYALVEVTSTLWARARVTPSARVDWSPIEEAPMG